MKVQKQIAVGSVVALVLTMGFGAKAQEDDFGGSASASSDLDAYNESPSPAKEDDGGGGSGKLKLERPLLLTKHTMQLGGEISINPRVMIRKGDVPNKSEGGGIFTFSPFFGYFVIDKLELLFDFYLTVPFGGTDGGSDVVLGFDGGARYFIDFNVVALYMGGMIGPNWRIPDNPVAPVEDYFNINLMVGVLMPLNRHIGVDLGMRMLFNIRVDRDFPDGADRTWISFPMGYLGVSGFFNIINGG